MNSSARRNLLTKSLNLAIAISFSIVVSISGFAQASPPPMGSAERELGIQQYNQQRYKDAIQTLRLAVKKNGKDYDAWYFLGLAQIREKQLKDATSSFEAALKIDSNAAGGHTGLAYSLLLRNKMTEALGEASAALAIDPNIPDAHYVSGVARLRLGSRDAALTEAEATIKLRPEFAPAYLLKSQALVSVFHDVVVADDLNVAGIDKERYRAAADALEKYLQILPNPPDKDTWVEQLESLRIMSNSYPKGAQDRIFSGKEVTTKVKVLTKPNPAYTERARRNEVTGTIVLRCVFGFDGSVKHFVVVVGLPDGLIEESIRAARKIKFVPATLNGRPVSMWMELQYNFELY